MAIYGFEGYSIRTVELKILVASIECQLALIELYKAES